MLDQQTIEAELIDYLENEVGIDAGIDRDEALISTGKLDSFAVIQLLTFLNEQYSVTVSPLEVNIENFDTVAAIGELVLSHTS